MDDAALDAAKEEAVKNEAVKNQEDPPEELEEEVEYEESEEEIEYVEEDLPTDHKERSALGRKTKAAFDRIDELVEVVGTQQQTIETLGNYLKPAPEPDPTMDEYMTRGEFLQQKENEGKAAKKYEHDFVSSVSVLGKDLAKEDREKVHDIIMEKYNYQSSVNGAIDGTKAFDSAYKDFVAKKIPLRQGKAPGVIKNQKTQKREKPLAKLKGASASYLEYVKRVDGADKALKLHKSL